MSDTITMTADVELSVDDLLERLKDDGHLDDITEGAVDEWFADTSDRQIANRLLQSVDGKDLCRWGAEACTDAEEAFDAITDSHDLLELQRAALFHGTASHETAAERALRAGIEPVAMLKALRACGSADVNAALANGMRLTEDERTTVVAALRLLDSVRRAVDHPRIGHALDLAARILDSTSGC